MKLLIKIVVVLSIRFTSCKEEEEEEEIQPTKNTKDFEAVELIVQHAFNDI